MYFIVKQAHAILSSHTDAWAKSSAEGCRQPIILSPAFTEVSFLELSCPSSFTHGLLCTLENHKSASQEIWGGNKCEWSQHLGWIETAQQSLNCIPWEVTHNPHLGKHMALREPMGPRTSGIEKQIGMSGLEQTSEELNMVLWGQIRGKYTPQCRGRLKDQ